MPQIDLAERAARAQRQPELRNYEPTLADKVGEAIAYLRGGGYEGNQLARRVVGTSGLGGFGADDGSVAGVAAATAASAADPFNIPSSVAGLASPELRDGWRELQASEGLGPQLVGGGYGGLKAFGLGLKGASGLADKAARAASLSAGSDFVDEAAGVDDAMGIHTAGKALGGAGMFAPLKYTAAATGSTLAAAALADRLMASEDGPPLPTRNPRRAGVEPAPQAPVTERSAEQPELLDRVGSAIYNAVPSLDQIRDFVGYTDDPDFTPIPFEDYKEKNLPPPPSMTEYVTEQANNARSEYLAQKPGWSKGAANSANAAAQLAEKQYPSFIADYERQKDGIENDYGKYKDDLAGRYNKYYSQTFKERNPLLARAITLGSYVAPAMIMRGGLNKINKRTGAIVDDVVKAKSQNSPDIEALAVKALEKRTLADPLLKAAVGTQAAAMPFEMRVAQDYWDKKLLPEGTPAQIEAGRRMSPENLMSEAGLSLLTGGLSAAFGAKGANRSRLPDAKILRDQYTKPDQFSKDLEAVNRRRADSVDALAQRQQIDQQRQQIDQQRQLAGQAGQLRQKALAESFSNGPSRAVKSRARQELDQRALNGFDRPLQGQLPAPVPSSSPPLSPPVKPPVSGGQSNTIFEGPPPKGPNGQFVRRDDLSNRHYDVKKVEGVVTRGDISKVNLAVPLAVGAGFGANTLAERAAQYSTGQEPPMSNLEFNALLADLKNDIERGGQY